MVFFTESGFVINHFNGVVYAVVRQRQSVFRLEYQCRVLTVGTFEAVFRIALLKTEHLLCKFFAAGNEHDMLLFLRDLNSAGVVAEE